MRTMLILMALALMALAASCDNLAGMGGGVLLENWMFEPGYPGDSSAEMAPWEFNRFTCRIAREKGGDGKRGYIALQHAPCVIREKGGLMALNGGARQDLASPIRAGHTYSISISGSLSATIPGRGKVASSGSFMQVRFIAYNDAPGEFPAAWAEKWTEHPGRHASMGEITVTGKKWESYSTIQWTADADYTGFAFCIVNSGTDSIPRNCETEMVFLDNVILQEQE